MPATRTIEQPYGQAYGGNAAENYERFFVPAIGEPFARDMIEAAALQPGERVLDVACGTGIVTRLAAERVAPNGIIAGLDVNPAMLAVARTLVTSSRTPVRWYETSAEAMPLPDAAFDVVLCQLGLMFMADKGAALREMRRVLAPGGRALISVPVPTAFFTALDEAIERHIGRLMAYAAIAETGFLLLALGQATTNSAGLVFLFLIPRGLGTAVWSLSLSVLRKSDRAFQLESVQGLARSYPFACGGIILAALSSAGFPLLGGFPPRLALWQQLSAQSSGIAIWLLIGQLGLLVGAVRQLAVLVTQKEEGPWKACEDLIQRGMIGLGALGLFILGVFPRVTAFVIDKLPLMFQHLSR
jgi:SAM-dependent methyltransferase